MVQSVTVDFNANLARFTGNVDKAIADLNKFQTNADRISSNIGRAFSSLGVGLSVAGFAAIIKSSIDAQDHLNDLAKTTRLSVEELAGLASASKKSGSDLDATAKAINKLSVEMGKNAEKFAALGVTAKNPLDAFAQLADVMNAIEDPQQRAAVGAVALGKGWETAASLMAEGGQQIRAMIKHGTELSNVTAESARRADEFNDKWEDMKTIAAGWGTAIADPIVAGILKIGKALNLEIDRGPGSISELFFGPKNKGGASGSFGDPPSAATPGKPSGAAVKKFIGGSGGGVAGGGGKTDLQRMIELGQRNLGIGIDSEEEMRLAATSRAMKDANAEFADLQRMLKVGEENELAAYYETAGEETMRLVAEQRELKKEIDELSQFTIEAARNMQDAMADGFFSIMQGEFDNLGDSFKKTLDRMVANAVAADLSRRLLGDYGKTGELGGWVGSLLGSGGGEGGGGFFSGLMNMLPKFAEGTPYVQRTGMAVVHQGERIIPADQNRAGFGGNITVIVQGGGNAPDVRRAAGQGAREALAAFSGAKRYA